MRPASPLRTHRDNPSVLSLAVPDTAIVSHLAQKTYSRAKWHTTGRFQGQEAGFTGPKVVGSVQGVHNHQFGGNIAGRCLGIRAEFLGSVDETLGGLLVDAGQGHLDLGLDAEGLPLVTQ